MSKFQFFIESYTIQESSRGYDNNDKYEYYDRTYWRVGKSRPGKSSIILDDKLSESSAKRLLDQIKAFHKIKDLDKTLTTLRTKKSDLDKKLKTVDDQLHNLRYIQSLCGRG